MLMIPDIDAPSDWEDGRSVYLASSPSDSVRIHGFVWDGVFTAPGVFVGSHFYRIEV